MTILSLLQKVPLQRFRVVRFLISGGSAVVFNFTLLYSLTEWLHVWYVASSVVAMVCSFVVSFVLQKFWTFERRSLERIYMQFSFYLVLGLANLALNTVFLYVLVEYAHLWYLLAQLLCTAVLATMNFFVYRSFIFNEQPV